MSSHKDIEVCGLYSDIEISRCVFTWDDDSETTYVGCNEFLYQPVRIKDDTYCYLYASDNYFYGNTETKPKGPWVRGIDFYFKIDNVTAVTSKYLSVGTITVQIMDPSNYEFHISLFFFCVIRLSTNYNVENFLKIYIGKVSILFFIYSNVLF